MLASLTDRSFKTNKEISETEKRLKALLEELRVIVLQNQSEVNEIKTKLNDLTRKVNSNLGRPGYPGGNVPGIFR